MEEGLEGPAIVVIWTSAVYILSPKWVGEGLRICHNPHHTLISNRVYTPDSHDAYVSGAGSVGGAGGKESGAASPRGRL
jgi:hypothetical protein